MPPRLAPRFHRMESVEPVLAHGQTAPVAMVLVPLDWVAVAAKWAAMVAMVQEVVETHVAMMAQAVVDRP